MIICIKKTSKDTIIGIHLKGDEIVDTLVYTKDNKLWSLTSEKCEIGRFEFKKILFFRISNNIYKRGIWIYWNKQNTYVIDHGVKGHTSLTPLILECSSW